ncbi:MAG: M28 family metallopeptidase [Promethearchaeota archaeon]
MNAKELGSKKLDNIISDENPNIENAYRITERLAFPRLIGTEGERKASEIVVDEFKKAGYNAISRDKFKTSFYKWIIVRLIFVFTGSVLVLLALSTYINLYLTLVLSILAIYISYKALGISVSSKIKLFKNEANNYETENIFTRLKSSNSCATVVFMGHWDSKSQSFSSLTRIIIFLISVFGSLILMITYLIFSLLMLIFNIYIPILNNILLDASITIAIIGAVNYFNKTGNNSPGAYDNAAAVGVLVELARYYKLNQIDNIDLLFLSTSSEELNLGGAIHFIKKFEKEFDKNSTYFINLDLIGGNELIRLITSYGIPRKVSSKKLNNLFVDSSEQLRIKLKDVYAPTGAWSDYMPIVNEGFEACWLGSQPGLKFVHTKNDTMDLVSKEGLKNILLLCIDVVKKLDKEYE